MFFKIHKTTNFLFWIQKLIQLNSENFAVRGEINEFEPKNMEPPMRIELMTYCLRIRHTLIFIYDAFFCVTLQGFNCPQTD